MKLPKKQWRKSSRWRAAYAKAVGKNRYRLEYLAAGRPAWSWESWELDMDLILERESDRLSETIAACMARPSPFLAFFS